MILNDCHNLKARNLNLYIIKIIIKKDSLKATYLYFVYLYLYLSELIISNFLAV